MQKFLTKIFCDQNFDKSYQSSIEGELIHRLQYRTGCNNSLPTYTIMTDGVLKYVKPLVIESSVKPLLYKLFDLIILSMKTKEIHNPSV